MPFGLPYNSSVLGFSRIEYTFISEYLDLLTSYYTAFDTDLVLNFHYHAIINRLKELADLPDSDNGELYTVLVEPVS